MTNALTIAAVTAVLKDLLENSLVSDFIATSMGDVTVTALPPDRISVGADERAGLNLFLYQVTQIGAMARAAGIHLIVATQRPEAKIVTPLIRSNLPGRIALRTASEADSIIVLGGRQTAGAYLLGKGDLLYQVGAQMHRLQSLLASTIQLP